MPQEKRTIVSMLSFMPASTQRLTMWRKPPAKKHILYSSIGSSLAGWKLLQNRMLVWLRILPRKNSSTFAFRQFWNKRAFSLVVIKKQVKNSASVVSFCSMTCLCIFSNTSVRRETPARFAMSVPFEQFSFICNRKEFLPCVNAFFILYYTIKNVTSVTKSQLESACIFVRRWTDDEKG